MIAEQLLEEYLEQSLRLETLEVIVKVIALIESISAPFYTSYLIHIFLIVEKLLEEVLPLPQHQKYFDRKVAE